MNQYTCNTCIHYCQHYTFYGNKLFQIYFGHCTYSRAKTKRPDSKICENYTQKIPEEMPFVTKEYLSKALLEHILNLELLPKIYYKKDETKKTQNHHD